MKDHCTFAPDFIDSFDLSGCCLMHDEEYEDKTISKFRADLNFYW
jgi:hypothetical protein